MADILQVNNLTVRFGRLVAVNDVSFSAERGRITSVIGPNGAGKSTLFNLVSGAFAPAAGQVHFDGHDVTGWPAHKLLRAGLARSFQITNLFPEMSVRDNLLIAAQVHESGGQLLRALGLSRRAAQRAQAMIERFALGDEASQQAGALSHGEQRRLEIAMALTSAPQLLLLDEPTQGMSHGDTQATAQLIKSLAGELSILLIEHDIDLVMNLSDHVVVLHQGAKLAEGTPQAVRANPAVQEAYFGSAHAAA